MCSLFALRTEISSHGNFVIHDITIHSLQTATSDVCAAWEFSKQWKNERDEEQRIHLVYLFDNCIYFHFRSHSGRKHRNWVLTLALAHKRSNKWELKKKNWNEILHKSFRMFCNTLIRSYILYCGYEERATARQPANSHTVTRLNLLFFFCSSHPLCVRGGRECLSCFASMLCAQCTMLYTIYEFNSFRFLDFIIVSRMC